MSNLPKDSSAFSIQGLVKANQTFRDGKTDEANAELNGMVETITVNQSVFNEYCFHHINALNTQIDWLTNQVAKLLSQQETTH